MNYFVNCKTFDEAKKIYRAMAQKLHPDHGGNEEAFKELNNQYESFGANTWNQAYTEYNNDKGFDFNASKATSFEAMIKRVLHVVATSETNARVELIGYWIYVFNSYEIKDTLKGLGFWFSSRHKAWVYNGGKKVKRYTGLTTDEVRNLHGSQVLGEGKKQETKRLEK